MAEFKVASAYADFHVNVDEGIDEAIARIKARARELNTDAKVVLDADTTVAKAKIKELGDTKEKVTVQADADTALAKAKVKALGDESASPKIKPTVDKSAAAKAEAELGAMAARSNAQFEALKFTALSVGLPAAAAIGAAGVTASVAAIGASFIGLQAIYAKNEADASRSISNLETVVTSSVETMSKGMSGPLAEAADAVTASFVRIRPQLDAAFKNSDVSVVPLTHAITDLAESAMPGFVTATEHLQAPIRGLDSLLSQTGSGLTDFFTAAVTGANGAEQEMGTFGGIIKDALGFLGQFFANVSNNGLPALQGLQAMLRQAEGALNALTTSGSGALGFFSGFGNAATGALAIVNALAQGLSLLPPQLTEFAGSFTASSLILQKFGIDGTKAFDGLGDRMKTARASATPLTSSISELASTALNPAMLATAGLSIGLEILGQHQRDAAAAAQAQTERVQTLAQALRESKGDLDANVQSTAAATLQQFKLGDGTRNLLADARTLGLNLQQVTAAYLGNNGALGDLNKQIDTAIQQHTKLVSVGDRQEKVVDSVGQAYQQYKDVLNSGDFAKATQDNKDLATATGQAVKPTTELSSAMDTLKDGTAQTADRVTALKTALDILSGRTPVFEDAIKQGNDQLRGMADNLKNGADKADGFGKSLINVDGTVNTVTKNGSSLQGLAESLQSSFLNAATGIDQMVRRGVPFAQATKTVNDSLQQQRDRFVEIAEKMGLTSKEAGDLADKYGLIPKTITTDITANTKTAKDAIDALPAYAAGTQGAIILSATTDPATGKINETVQYADGSTGYITLDGYKDPVTGKIQAAIQYADGSKGTISIDGLNTLAKEGAVSAVRFADGQTGTITVKANTDQARGSVQGFLNDYLHSVITIPVRAAPAPGTPPLPFGAVGGVFGGGGVRRFATGGLAGAGLPTLQGAPGMATDVGGGGIMSGPGTGTSDSMLALVSNTEAVINAKATAANLNELAAINNGQRNYQRWPDTGRPPSSAGPTSVVANSSPTTINIYQQPGQDPYVLAAEISRELELRRRAA